MKLYMVDFYTYAYLRADGTPYYVGKGCNKRLYAPRKYIRPPKDKSKIIFLKRNLTEEEAFKHEIYMIAVFGRKDLGTGILHNRTNGGDGNSGHIKSDEERRMISKRMSGSNHPLYGKPVPEERKRLISSKNKGRNNPQSKNYIITDPKGIEYKVIGNLKEFCKTNNISYDTMTKAAYRNTTCPRPSNGWSIRFLERSCG
jgi:hypothetical protein